jgi:hypothetical protein
VIPVAMPEARPKKRPRPRPVPDAEDNGVRYRAGQQPQRIVLSTQQVVGKIQTAQHIKTSARNADGRDRMVVHSMIVELTPW